jgi:hypothetical protein
MFERPIRVRAGLVSHFVITRPARVERTMTLYLGSDTTFDDHETMRLGMLHDSSTDQWRELVNV